VALVRDALGRYQMLTVELTEIALMESEAEVTGHLKELRDLGVCVSIDDFGTGNSSLSRLRTLPLDELKVDRSFIADIATDERALGRLDVALERQRLVLHDAHVESVCRQRVVDAPPAGPVHESTVDENDVSHISHGMTSVLVWPPPG
jgi:predicted signal transduction protein with EAL and GGDEF domain